MSGYPMRWDILCLTVWVLVLMSVLWSVTAFNLIYIEICHPIKSILTNLHISLEASWETPFIWEMASDSFL